MYQINSHHLPKRIVWLLLWQTLLAHADEEDNYDDLFNKMPDSFSYNFVNFNKPNFFYSVRT